jgi:hypothetical protein
MASISGRWRGPHRYSKWPPMTPSQQVVQVALLEAKQWGSWEYDTQLDILTRQPSSAMTEYEYRAISRCPFHTDIDVNVSHEQSSYHMIPAYPAMDIIWTIFDNIKDRFLGASSTSSSVYTQVAIDENKESHQQTDLHVSQQKWTARFRMTLVIGFLAFSAWSVLLFEVGTQYPDTVACALKTTAWCKICFPLPRSDYCSVLMLRQRPSSCANTDEVRSTRIQR